MADSDTNDFEQFIAADIDFTTGTPPIGNSGDMEQFITADIDLAEFAKAAAPPAGAIMNQIQFSNFGADLYNGALIL